MQSGIGTRLRAYGDSFVYYNFIAAVPGSGYPSSLVEGVVPMLEAMTMGAITLDMAQNLGFTGATTADLYTAYATYVSGNFADFDILWLHGGPPDSMSVEADAVAAVNNMKAMCADALSNGKVVFLPEPNPPRGLPGFPVGSPADDLYAFMNAELKSFCDQNPGCYYLGHYQDWVDPTVTTGLPASGVTKDGIHAASIGCINAARRMVDTIGHLLPKRPPVQTSTNIYSYDINPDGNILGLISADVPQMLGDSGVVSNASGVAVSNFTLAGLSLPDPSNVVGSVEPTVSGYGSSGGQRQILTISPMASGGFIQFTINQSGAVSGLAGQNVEALCEVELSGMTGNTQLHLTVLTYDGITPAAGGAMFNGNADVIPWPDGKYLLRTVPATYPTAGNLVQWQLFIGFNPGGSGVIKIGKPCVRIAQ